MTTLPQKVKSGRNTRRRRPSNRQNQHVEMLIVLLVLAMAPRQVIAWNEYFNLLPTSLGSSFGVWLQHGGRCDGSEYAPLREAPVNTLIDSTNGIYFLSFGQSYGASTDECENPFSMTYPVDELPVNAAICEQYLRVKTQASGGIQGINVVDSNDEIFGQEDACQKSISSPIYQSIQIESPMGLRFAPCYGDNCGTSTNSYTYLKELQGEVFQAGAQDCDRYVSINFPVEVKWIGLEVKMLNDNKVNEVGLYYKIQATPYSLLTALTFASSTEEVILFDGSLMTTLPIQSLGKTPSMIDPSLVIKYSIEGLSGSGSPQVTLVSESVALSDQADYQVDLTGVAPGEYQYTVTGAHICINDSYVLRIKVTSLELDRFTQNSITVDLESDDQEIEITPPLFKHDYLNEFELQDPTSPYRSIYFKAIDLEEDDISDLVKFTIVENNDFQKVKVNFKKVATNFLNAFQIISCFSYGDYENLQHLCDEKKPISIINAQGKCFTEFQVSLDSSRVQELQSKAFVTNLNDGPYELVDLATITSSLMDQECGSLGFKLLNEAQGGLVDMTVDGNATFKTVTEPSWLGEHLVSFMVYLKDLDPIAIFNQSLDLNLSLKVQQEQAASLGSEQIVGHLLRESPVSLNPIEPIYFAEFGEKSYYKYQFADPLALNVNPDKDELALIQGLVPHGIKISIKRVTIPFVQDIELIYDRGAGFGTLEFMIDGEAAQRAFEADSCQSHTSGQIYVSVEDVSPGGKQSFFILYFELGVKENSKALCSKSFDLKENIEIQSYKAQLLEVFRNYPKQEPADHDEKFVLITPSSFNNYGQISLKMNLPIQNEILKLMLQDQKVRKQILQVQVLEVTNSSIDENSKDVVFEWEVEEVSETEISLKLKFKEPLLISNSLEIDHHVFSAQVLETEFFTSVYGQEYEKKEILEKIPLQVPEEDQALMDRLVLIAQTLAVITACVFTASAALNLVLGFGLSELISSLKYIQLMIYPMGFKVRYPINFLKFTGTLIWVVKFDVYPSEDINNEFFQFTDTKPFSAGLEFLLHEGKNFALSAGSGLLILYTMIAFIGIYGLISLAKYFCKFDILTKMKQSFSRQLFWNRFIDFFEVSMIDLVLSSIIQLQNIEWKLNGDKYSVIMAIVILTIYAVYPIVSFFVMRYFFQRGKLQDQSYVDKYGTLSTGIDTKTYSQLAQPIASWLMRTFLVLLLVNDNMETQLFLYQLNVLLYTVYMAYAKPMMFSKDFALEIVQLSFLMCHNLMMAGYTEFIPSVQSRYDIGWVSIAIYIAQLLLCLSLVLLPGLKTVKLTSIKLKNKYGKNKPELQQTKSPQQIHRTTGQLGNQLIPGAQGQQREQPNQEVQRSSNSNLEISKQSDSEEEEKKGRPEEEKKGSSILPAENEAQLVTFGRGVINKDDFVNSWAEIQNLDMFQIQQSQQPMLLKQNKIEHLYDKNAASNDDIFAHHIGKNGIQPMMSSQNLGNIGQKRKPLIKIEAEDDQKWSQFQLKSSNLDELDAIMTQKEQDEAMKSLQKKVPKVQEPGELISKSAMEDSEAENSSDSGSNKIDLISKYIIDTKYLVEQSLQQNKNNEDNLNDKRIAYLEEFSKSKFNQEKSQSLSSPIHEQYLSSQQQESAQRSIESEFRSLAGSSYQSSKLIISSESESSLDISSISKLASPKLSRGLIKPQNETETKEGNQLADGL